MKSWRVLRCGGVLSKSEVRSANFNALKTHHISLQWPGAQSVFIAGSFNDWAPDATPLLNGGDGSWAVELALPPGRYEYRFVVDGEWVDDPNAAESTPTPFGGANALIVVAE